MFISDIHGSIENLEKCIEIFEIEKADKLVILGDTGSQVDNRSNQIIADTLNLMKDKLEMVRGNCDTIDFEEMLFLKLVGTQNLYINGKIVTITHGHYYNSYELPSNCGEIFIQGHTHIPMLQKINDRIIANPGSVSRPRGCDLRCYIILDDEKIVLKTLEGKIVKEILIK